jgi:hypothetical protein
MRASRVGAWLAPVFGFSQGSVLRLVGSHNHTCSGKTGPFLFQSISQYFGHFFDSEVKTLQGKGFFDLNKTQVSLELNFA